jgi:bacillithiol system protein YtxJ
MEIKELNSVEEWESLKASAGKEEIVLLKKSPLSTVSFVGEKFFDMWCGKLPEDSRVICVKIDVIEAKELSNSLTGEFGIKHESPQIIWLDKDRRVKWTGHHHQITLDNLNHRLKTE